MLYTSIIIVECRFTTADGSDYHKSWIVAKKSKKSENEKSNVLWRSPGWFDWLITHIYIYDTYILHDVQLHHIEYPSSRVSLTIDLSCSWWSQIYWLASAPTHIVWSSCHAFRGNTACFEPSPLTPCFPAAHHVSTQIDGCWTKKSIPWPDYPSSALTNRRRRRRAWLAARKLHQFLECELSVSLPTWIHPIYRRRHTWRLGARYWGMLIVCPPGVDLSVSRLIAKSIRIRQWGELTDWLADCLTD